MVSSYCSKEKDVTRIGKRDDDERRAKVDEALAEALGSCGGGRIRKPGRRKRRTDFKVKWIWGPGAVSRVAINNNSNNNRLTIIIIISSSKCHHRCRLSLLPFPC